VASIAWKRRAVEEGAEAENSPSLVRLMASFAWLIVLFFLSVSYLVDATFNPFLYFRF
jgi:alginate O-acetyltransferase complex protein AlgI